MQQWPKFKMEYPVKVKILHNFLNLKNCLKELPVPVCLLVLAPLPYSSCTVAEVFFLWALHTSHALSLPWNHSRFVHRWSSSSSLMSLKISLKAPLPVTTLQAEYILPLLPHCPLHFPLQPGSRFNFCIDLVQKKRQRNQIRGVLKAFP